MKQKQKNKFVLIMLLVVGVISSTAICSPRLAYAAPTISSISPTIGSESQEFTIQGTGFGGYLEGTSLVRFYPDDGNSYYTEAPVSTWEESVITAIVPAGLISGHYRVVVVDSSGAESGNALFEIIDPTSDPNYIGNPVSTGDVYIAPGKAINLSDSIRQIAQGFLLPLKSTIVEIGRYMQSSLVFQLQADSETNSLEDFWKIAQGLANTLVVLTIVMIGYAVIFRYRINTFQLRRLLPRFVVCVILANWSYFFARVITDSALIFTYSIFDLAKIPSPDQLTQALMGNLHLNVFVISTLIIYLFILIVFSCAAVFLLLRIVAIWLLIVMSPILLIVAILPQFTNLVGNWFKNLLRFVFLGPLIAFLLSLGVFLSSTVNSQFPGNSGLIQAFVGIATLFLLLFSPTLLSTTSSFTKFLIPSRSRGGSNKEKSRPEAISQPQLPGSEATPEQRLVLENLDLSKLKDFATAHLPASTPEEIVQGELAKSTEKEDISLIETKDDSSGQEKKDAHQPRRLAIRDKLGAGFTERKKARAGVDSNAIKLFAKAPVSLIASWLGDRSKHSLIERAVVYSSGEIDTAKAEMITDSDSGQQIIRQSLTEGSEPEKQAFRTMVGNALLGSPDRIKNLAQAASDEDNPSRNAALAILKAGVTRLGQRLEENPKDEALQATAEHIVMQAPQLLAKLIDADSGGAGEAYLQEGIRRTTKNAGEKIHKVIKKQPHALITKEHVEQTDEIDSIATAAAYTVQQPSVQMTQLLQTETGRLFVASALAQKTEGQQLAREKFVQELKSNPKDESLQATAAAAFKFPGSSEQTLQPEIAQAALNFLNLPEFREQPDYYLASRIIALAPSEAIIPTTIATKVLENVTDEHFSSHTNKEEATRLRPIFEANKKLLASADDMRSLSSSERYHDTMLIPQLNRVDPQLAELLAIRLVSTTPPEDLNSLPINVYQTAVQGFGNPAVNSILDKSTIQYVNHTIMQNQSFFSQLNTDQQNTVMQNTVAAALDKQALTPEVLVSIINSVPVKHVPAIIPQEVEKNMAVSQMFGKVINKTVSSLPGGQLMTPELAAKLLLATPKEQVPTLPWDMIKEVFNFLLTLDRKSPLYLKLMDKIEDYPELAQLANSLSPEVRDHLPDRSISDASRQTNEPKQTEDAKRTTLEFKPEVEQLAKTALADVDKLPAEMVKKVSQELTQSEGKIDPELAAKVVKAMPLNELKETDQKVQKAATQYLLDKKETDGTDAEVAARVVAVTPPESLGQLNESIMTLASTIAKSNISFADRDQLQEFIIGELGALAQPSHEADKKKEEDDMLATAAAQPDIKKNISA